MSSSEHARHEELAVGHALHALEPEDEAAAVEHLRICASCRRLAADTEAVGAALAVLAPPVRPPAELGERLRAAVAAEPRGVPAGRRPLRQREAGPGAARPDGDRPADERRSLERPTGSRLGATRVGASQPGSTGAGSTRPGSTRPGTTGPGSTGPTRSRGSRGRWLRAAPWLVTAAAVAALAVVTGWGTSVEAERDQLLRAADLREQVLDRLADPAARVVRLAGQEGDAVDASAAVLLDEGGRAYVVVEGLEPNDPQSTYVLWQVPESGMPQAVGVFDVPTEDVAAGGAAVAEVGPVTLRPEQLAALAVSREEGRVAPPAPSTPLLVGTPA